MIASASGTIVAQGGAIGGWGLLMHQGAVRFVYNLFGVNLFVIDAERPAPTGAHQVRAEFAYDGGGLAKGGTVTLFYDGEKAGEGRVGVTQPMLFSATEGLDIGQETGTTVLPDSDPASTVFNGEIQWVELSVGKDDHSHMVDPDQHLHVLMSKQ
jgi:hypothetical protein